MNVRSFETIDTYVSECFKNNLLDIVMLDSRAELKNSGRPNTVIIAVKFHKRIRMRVV